ncbi:transposase family protein [Streptomyces sp. NPDC098789]|uniref:transposase family protein n=1 Tax=Streptomyces sp. NPDC098789 TaxID=3366098 RepID=UPI003826D6CC
MERLRELPDPRLRRGVRHPFVAVLLVAASAVIADARSYAAIGQWSASVPQHALARLGARVTGALGVRVAPSTATIRRVIALVCPGGRGGQSRPRLPACPDPRCPPPGRDDRRRPHRHPAASS